MLSPDLHETVAAIAAAATSKKAFQIVALDVSELTSMAEAFVLCSGGGSRQVYAIADAIRRHLKPMASLLHREAEGTGAEWILMDYGDVVVHVFTEDRRSYYALERLWGDAPRIPLPEAEAPASPA